MIHTITMIISLNGINRSLFVTDLQFFFCEVIIEFFSVT